MSVSPFIKTATSTNFTQEVIEASRETPVLVDFWAEWCGPCKVLMPLLGNLVETYAGKFILAKVNTEEEQALAAQFGIRSIPTVKLFKNGEVVDEFMGALSESEVRAFLDKHIPRESDLLIDQTQELLLSGDITQASELLDRAAMDDPGNPRLPLLKLQLQAESGDLEETEQAISQLPLDLQQAPEVQRIQAQLLFKQAVRGAPEMDTLVATAPDNSQAAYQLAARQIINGDYQSGLDGLFELMRRDKNFADGAPHKAILAAFKLLDGDNPLVGRYRGKLFNLLH